MTGRPSKPAGSGNYQAAAAAETAAKNDIEADIDAANLEADETSDHSHGLSSRHTIITHTASEAIFRDRDTKYRAYRWACKILNSCKGMELAMVANALVQLMDDEEFKMWQRIQNVPWHPDDVDDDGGVYHHIPLHHDDDDDHFSMPSLGDDDDDDHDGSSSTTMTTMTDTNHCHGYSSSSSSEEQCPHHGPLPIGWPATVEMLRHEYHRYQALVSQHERDQHRLQHWSVSMSCINVNPCLFFYGREAAMVAWQQQQRQRRQQLITATAARTSPQFNYSSNS